jgi:hypothetical protein
MYDAFNARRVVRFFCVANPRAYGVRKFLAAAVATELNRAAVPSP